MNDSAETGSRPSGHKATREGNRQFAAVDLGSNSFHMIVAEYGRGGLRLLDRHKEMVRLAAGLDESGYLSMDARFRALRCMARFGQRLRHLPREHVRVVGTNTLRRAVNARAFLVAAETAIGHPVEVISGFEEARLIYRGVGYGLPQEADHRVVLDIGGGSTEFIRGNGNEVLAAESVGLGCVGLSREWFPDGRITPGNWQKAYDAAALELQGLDNLLQATGDEEFVGSSGTIRAALRAAREAGWCETELTRSAIAHLREALLDAGHVDRIELAGLSARRQPVFAGGIVMLQACFEILNIPRLRVADHALREGVLADLAGRLDHADPRENTVRALATRYGADPVQAEHVRSTAMALYEYAAGPWRLNSHHRRWLAWAAGLHEIGLAISHSKYHQHGAYLLRQGDLAGFSRQEQAAMAALVAGHRRNLNLPVNGEIPDRELIPLSRLCVLLRLAVLLNRGRAGTPPGAVPALSVHGNHLTLAFPDNWLSAHPLSRLDLEREAGLLEQAGITLEFT